MMRIGEMSNPSKDPPEDGAARIGRSEAQRVILGKAGLCEQGHRLACIGSIRGRVLGCACFRAEG